MAMNKPTCEDLENMASVSREADDSWRRGAYITEVFHRKEDDTYWMASYRLSAGGETNELREGLADIAQVIPYERTVVDYKLIGEEKDGDK